MYLSVFIVYAIILVLVSPALWVAWWLLADFGEKVTGSDARLYPASTGESRRRVA